MVNSFQFLVVQPEIKAALCRTKVDKLMTVRFFSLYSTNNVLLKVPTASNYCSFLNQIRGTAT